MANFKEKLSVQVVAIRSIKSEQASLFIIIAYLKYKFVSHLPKGYLHYKTIFCNKVTLDV